MAIGPIQKRYTEERFIGFLPDADAGAKFGGMNVSGAWRLNALLSENGNLKRLLAK